MLTGWFQQWLGSQALWLRVVVNGLVAAMCVLLAFATGKFVLLLMALVVAAFAFNLDDLKRARAWLGGGQGRDLHRS